MQSLVPDGDLRPGAGPSATVPPPDSPYWGFYEQVAAAQLAAWVPTEPGRVLDLSGCGSRYAGQLAAAGHDVLVATGPDLDGLEPPREGPGRLRPVVADIRSLGWLRDGSVDAVLAESRALSMCLATEVVAEDLHRILRPGGRLLLVVETLVLGLARLAEQGRWAELADVPAADVVLVPSPDGSITRCFWPAELTALLTGAGLVVDWMRPRTVLTPAAVEHALATGGPEAMAALVRTETRLAENQTDSTGLHLVVSARRPAGG